MSDVKSEVRIQGWIEASSDQVAVVEQNPTDYKPHNAETQKILGRLDRVERSLRKVAGG